MLSRLEARVRTEINGAVWKILCGIGAMVAVATAVVLYG